MICGSIEIYFSSNAPKKNYHVNVIAMTLSVALVNHVLIVLKKGVSFAWKVNKMSNSFEGLRIIFEEDFTLEINPKLSQIDLSSYDIKYLLFKYEENHCGCCEGSHESIEIKPEDLFDFVDSGGIKEIEKLKEKLKEKDGENTKLKNKIKEFKSVLKDLKEDDVNVGSHE